MTKILASAALLAWAIAALAVFLPYLSMEAVRDEGSAWILSLQDQGQGLQTLSRGLSLLGDDVAYIAVLPMLVFVWPDFGTQAFVLFFVNLFLNSVLKTLLHAPRPSWTSTAGLVCEIEYGNPSGHSQSAFAFYLLIAQQIASHTTNRGVQVLAWCVAVFLAAAVAASRCVVGAHFPHQVLGGSLVGVAIFITFFVASNNAALTDALQARVSNLRAGAILALQVSLAGALLAVLAWGITAATFDFPEAWAKRAALSCEDDEKIDEFGGLRYALMAVGLLSSMALAQGVGFLTSAAEAMRHSLWRRVLSGFLGVVVAAVLYLGLGEVISKQWHIALVLILRYYVRGLVVGVGVLLLLPLACLQMPCMLSSHKALGTSPPAGEGA